MVAEDQRPVVRISYDPTGTPALTVSSRRAAQRLFVDHQHSDEGRGEHDGADGGGTGQPNTAAKSAPASLGAGAQHVEREPLAAGVDAAEHNRRRRLRR